LVLALLPPGSDLLHRGQSSAQLAELFLRAGRADDARAEAGRGIDLLERVYAEAGGRLGRGGHGVAPRDDPGRPALGSSYYGVLMDAYFVASRVERAAGDREISALWLERAAVAAPDPDVGFDVLEAHGEALLAGGRPAEALAEIEKVRSIEPHDLPLAVLAGRALHALKRDREAIEAVDGALASSSKIDPLDLSDANFLLGLAYHDLGEEERMRFHFREALAKNPGHPRAEWMRRILEEGDPQGVR
jgi:tetratricopeptide (TPR) repeat protein